jgi:antitoxin (DNA-binding transcriptional repressor) of toxin-antitoxin stability system
MSDLKLNLKKDVLVSVSELQSGVLKVLKKYKKSKRIILTVNGKFVAELRPITP